MIRSLKTYILFASVLLLCTPAQLDAHFFKKKVRPLPVRTIKSLQIKDSGVVEEPGSFSTCAAALNTDSKNEEVSVLVIENQEEDDLVSLRKLLKNNNYAVSLIFTDMLGVAVHTESGFFPFSADALHSSLKYLLIQVFRI